MDLIHIHSQCKDFLHCQSIIVVTRQIIKNV